MVENVIKDYANALNLVGSSSERNNWRAFYEDHCGRQFDTCSVYGCSSDAQVGGHHHLQGEPYNLVFIAPVCQSCNKQNGFRKMKNNVVYVQYDSNSLFRF